MFIASLAIACGSWSRSTRLFQGIYTGWWYLAMNNVPNMDFTGITGQRHAWGYCSPRRFCSPARWHNDGGTRNEQRRCDY
jgi:hypothetical protein